MDGLVVKSRAYANVYAKLSFTNSDLAIASALALGLLAIGGLWAWFGNVGDWRGLAPLQAAGISGSAPASDAPVESAALVSQSAGKIFRDCSDCPQMVSIPAGSFTMGSPESEPGRRSNEGPQHQVTVPAFAAGKYEVTWTEWDQCVDEGGCTFLPADGFGGGPRPVTNVSWNEAIAYTKWLSVKTGKTYRLLSEAEWEYAARAGSKGRWSFGDDESALTAQAWFRVNAGSATHAVGTNVANRFGLNDMYGNVWEWAQDCLEDSYAAGQPINGGAHQSGSCSFRVGRGGSWKGDVPVLRSAYRGRGPEAFRNDDLGFRLARTPS